MFELIVGFVIGYIVKGVVENIRLARDIEESEEEARESASKKKPLDFIAYVKEDSGVFYLYNNLDDTFLAQGRTIEEIVDHLSKRFPGCRVFMTGNDKAAE